MKPQNISKKKINSQNLNLRSDITSNSSLYNKKSAINHVKSLAFGRRVGTEGEIRSIDYIRNCLTTEGIKFEMEPFFRASIWYPLKFYSVWIVFLVFADSLSSFFIAGFWLFKLMIIIILVIMIKKFIEPAVNLGWFTYKLNELSIPDHHIIAVKLNGDRKYFQLAGKRIF